MSALPTSLQSFNGRNVAREATQWDCSHFSKLTLARVKACHTQHPGTNRMTERILQLTQGGLKTVPESSTWILLLTAAEAANTYLQVAL